MDDISWSRPRPTATRPRTSCAVCGLRAEVLCITSDEALEKEEQPWPTT